MSFVVPLKVLVPRDGGFLLPLAAHFAGTEVAENGSAGRGGRLSTREQLDQDLSTLCGLRRFCTLPHGAGSEEEEGAGTVDGATPVDLLSGTRRHARLLSGEQLCDDPHLSLSQFPGRGGPHWGYDMQKRYHASLAEAESRGFPVSDADGLGGADRLAVAWTSAFGPTRTVQRANLRFERACVLFNLAALESYLGSEADRTTREGSDKAIKCYQNAAGMFAHLRKMEIDPPAPMPPAASAAATEDGGRGSCADLSPGCLAALEYAMLAQAQACMFEKTSEHQATEGAHDTAQQAVWWGCLAKIAMGVVRLYERAIAAAEKGAPHVDRRWGYAMKANLVSYRAIALYWQSFLDEEKAAAAGGEGLGLAVGRLRLSRAFVSTVAMEHGRKANMDTTHFEEYLEGMTAKLDAVEGENKLKLREPPVRPNLIPAIPYTTLVKSRALGPEFFPRSLKKRLFVGLLPPTAMEKHKEYEALSDALYARCSNTIDTVLSRIAEARASLNLTPPLEIYNDIGGAPDGLWKLIKKAQEGGVRHAISNNWHHYEQTQLYKDTMHEIKEELIAAVGEHRRFREKNPGLANISNEDSQYKQFMKQIAMKKQQLDDALAQDQSLSPCSSEMLNEKTTRLQIDRYSLDRLFPPMPQDEAERCNIKKLRNLLDVISRSPAVGKAILGECAKSKALLDMPNKLAHVDKMKLDSSNIQYGGLVDTAIARVEEKFGGMVQSFVETSDDLLPDLAAACAVHAATLRDSATAAAAEDRAAGLQTTCEEVETIDADAQRGAEFYGDEIRRLLELQEEVRAFTTGLMAERFESEDADAEAEGKQEEEESGVDDQLLAQLIEMGFDAETASGALLRNDNAYEASLNDCLS